MTRIATDKGRGKGRIEGPLPAASGVARWVGLVPNAHTLVCGAGWLRITTAAGVVSDFWVKTVEGPGGEVLGYRLLKQGEDGAETGESYDVDVDGWRCDCRDYVSRSHLRADGLCKHGKAIRAALAKVV